MGAGHAHDVALLRASLLRLTGRDLYDGLDLSQGAEAAVRRAPYALVAHDASDDPMFVYGNNLALELFEMTLDELIALPSRLCAEQADQPERDALLARVTENGWIDDYSGVRVAKSGRRFRIEDAVVWNVVDSAGVHHGQAALFSSWSRLEKSRAPEIAVHLDVAVAGPGASSTTLPIDAEPHGAGDRRAAVNGAGAVALLQRPEGVEPTASPGDVTPPQRLRVRSHLTLSSATGAGEGPAISFDAAAPPDIRPLLRDELDTVLGWADDGWNPGATDADLLWAADPSGLWGVEIDDVLVAAGSDVAYDKSFGLLGFVLVRPEMRRRGLGRVVLPFLLDDLRERLEPDAVIAADAPPWLVDHLQRFGFVPDTRISRMRGTAGFGRRGPHAGELRALSRIPFDDVVAYDAGHMGVARRELIKAWVQPGSGLGIAVYERGEILGMGVVRPGRTGFAIGPLYADQADVAEDILIALSSHAAGSPITVDIPDTNAAALDLAARHDLRSVTSRTRMVRGQMPVHAAQDVYAITAYELG